MTSCSLLQTHLLTPRRLWGALLILASAGCATTEASQRAFDMQPGPAGAHLNLQGPATLAFGTRTGHRSVPVDRTAIEPFLRATTPSSTPRPTVASGSDDAKRIVRPETQRDLAKLASVAPPVAPASSSLELSHTRFPTRDSERYSAREAQSSELLQYRGGDPIVIGSGTLIIALLVVILILLLT